MPLKKRIVDLKYDAIKHETNDAYLFYFSDDHPDVWIPKSWCEVDEQDKIVSLPEHRAVEKEIEGYVV